MTEAITLIAPVTWSFLLSKSLFWSKPEVDPFLLLGFLENSDCMILAKLNIFAMLFPFSFVEVGKPKGFFPVLIIGMRQEGALLFFPSLFPSKACISGRALKGSGNEFTECTAHA